MISRREVFSEEWRSLGMRRLEAGDPAWATASLHGTERMPARCLAKTITPFSAISIRRFFRRGNTPLTLRRPPRATVF